MYKVIGIFLLLLNTIRKDTGTQILHIVIEKKKIYIYVRKSNESMMRILL